MTDANAEIAPPESLRAAVWAQFRKHKGAVFGLVVLGLLIVFSVLGPFVWAPRSCRSPRR